MNILVAFRVNPCETVDLAFVDSADVHDSKRVIIKRLHDDSEDLGFYPAIIDRFHEDPDSEFGKFIPCNFTLSYNWYLHQDWDPICDDVALTLRQFVESYIDLWRVFDGGFSYD